MEAGLIESTGIKIQSIFIEAAETCLTKFKKKTNIEINSRKNKIKINKKWYDEECRNIKNRVKIAANTKHRNPLDTNKREEHKNMLKLYKDLGYNDFLFKNSQINSSGFSKITNFEIFRDLHRVL